MRPVDVIGTGIIRFNRYPEKSFSDLARPAVLAAMAEAGVERKDIQAAWCGTALGGMMAGQRILKPMGMTGMPISNMENACASSATAFRDAWTAVAAGLYDTVLVIGIEKLTKLDGGPLPLEQEDFEAAYGLSMPALYAMRAKRYMHDYGATDEDLARVSVKARRHGAMNPDAQFQREVTLEEVMGSRKVADPFRLLHCCPTGDGASAVVISATRQGTMPGAVRVRSSTLNSGVFMAGGRDFTSPEITRRAAAMAYEASGLGPGDIDLAEIHDAFVIAEWLYYEALGFCGKGEAPRLVREGTTSVGGRIPVNPSGGLLSKGHPVGASGTGQIVEVVRQLQGRCGARQVHGARIGMTHITGGGVSGLDHGACAIHVFEKH